MKPTSKIATAAAAAATTSTNAPETESRATARRRASTGPTRDRRDTSRPMNPVSTETVIAHEPTRGPSTAATPEPTITVDDSVLDETQSRDATADAGGGRPVDASKGGNLVVPDGDKPKEQLSPDMKDAFKRFRHSQLAQRSSRVALALSQLMRIRLPYPRQIEAMAEIEELRLLGLEMRGEQQLALNIFNRTGTGKSTIASQYKLMRGDEDLPGVKSVVHARLGTSGTARDLYVAIMSELGDGFASAGTEPTLRRRAMHAMTDAGVELLILDETQHSGQKSGFSREVTAELKIMLDTGRVPIVLLGTEAAVPLVAADRELSGRMFSPCRLDPLDMDDDDDFELWQGFVGGLDTRMVSDGIVSAPAGLADEEVALALGEVCDGVIGQLMRVMTMALRNTVRDRRDVVSMGDVAVAVDEWSLEHGFANSNPFRNL
ncbi:TniB family NTP-binding protein [Sphingomonas sp. NFX23]|uniref:TniB family NTP-binding protein n=1 Tax=Sphingomonas sp. NFX23 TaxID=2819532 RepID=UPI003CF3D4FE